MCFTGAHLSAMNTLSLSVVKYWSLGTDTS